MPSNIGWTSSFHSSKLSGMVSLASSSSGSTKLSISRFHACVRLGTRLETFLEGSGNCKLLARAPAGRPCKPLIPRLYIGRARSRMHRVRKVCGGPCKRIVSSASWCKASIEGLVPDQEGGRVAAGRGTLYVHVRHCSSTCILNYVRTSACAAAQASVLTGVRRPVGVLLNASLQMCTH